MKKNTNFRRFKTYTESEIRNLPYTSPVAAICIDEPHRHTFYEFGIITSGTCLHSVDGNPPIEVSRGDFYVITPDNYHQLSQITNTHKHRDFYASAEKMKEICKLFSYDFLSELQTLSPVFRKRLTESQISSLEEKALLFNPNLYTFSPEMTENLHTAIIVELLGIILQTKHEKKKLLPDWINVLIQKIDNGDFILNSVSEIIKTTGYAHGYVCRQFKKHVGQTLLSYNNNAKLRQSLSLLRTNTVLQTASLLGWDNPKNYNIAFKKIYGVSPSQYKKSLQEDDI